MHDRRRQSGTSSRPAFAGTALIRLLAVFTLAEPVPSEAPAPTRRWGLGSRPPRLPCCAGEEQHVLLSGGHFPRASLSDVVVGRWAFSA